MEPQHNSQTRLPLESTSITPKPAHPRTIDEAFEEVLKSNFSALVIGQQMLYFIDSDDGIDRAVALAAIVGKARQERVKRRPRSSDST
jgi:hypothetical protein